MNDSSSRLRPLLPVVLLAAALLACAGCSDDDDTTAPPADTPTVYHSEGLLMEGFKQALGGMDIERYSGLLDENFTFRFCQQDMEDPELGLVTDILTRVQEDQIMGRMFAHVQGSGGQTIMSIDFNVLDILTPFVRLSPDDPYHPGAVRCDYETDIVFYYTNTYGDDASFSVRSLQRFYMIDTPSAADENVMEWRLCGWEDLGAIYKRPCDSTSIGSIKALFLQR